MSASTEFSKSVRDAAVEQLRDARRAVDEVTDSLRLGLAAYDPEYTTTMADDVSRCLFWIENRILYPDGRVPAGLERYVGKASPPSEGKG